MGTRSRDAAPADEAFAEARLEIAALMDAWTRRHRLRRGTPEYDSALEREERLMTRVWRMFGRGDAEQDKAG